MDRRDSRSAERASAARSATRPIGPKARAGSRVAPSEPRRSGRASTASSTPCRARARSWRPPRRRSSPRHQRAPRAQRPWSRRAPSDEGNERLNGWLDGSVRCSLREPLARALPPGHPCLRGRCAREACRPAPSRSEGRARRVPCATGRPRRRAGQGAAGSVHANGRSRRSTLLAVGGERSYTSCQPNPAATGNNKNQKGA